MELINGDCLLELKKLKDKSIDFVYCDLPYNQTACHWDKKLDHIALWEELKRIAKNDRTPFFFSCTTKFGFELYNTAPKGWFRWDLVWEKNRAAGFLNAYKLPMRKHEMVYCFAKKTPEYDVSSHKEFVDGKNCKGGRKSDDIYNLKNNDTGKRHKDPLPTSILPPQEDHELVYCFAQKTPEYDVSSHLTGEEIEKKPSETNKFLKEGGYVRECHKSPHKSKVLKEPLPTSILPPQDIPSSWCKYKLDEGINHRTSKPVKLMEFLLKYWSKEGDVVLDPCAGSGSMGCAAMNMNRKFIGIEKDPDIFAIMKDRLDKHKKGEKVIIKPKKNPKKNSL
jgi:DNA modification methylase